MDGTTKKILEIVTDIQEQMSTKKDIVDLQKQINNHTRQIEVNTKAIAEMSEQLRSIFGYAKEIDMIFSRLAVLEKQMGAQNK